MQKTLALLGLGLAVPTAVLAHHGWGSYDAAHPITVAGTAARLCAVLSLTIWFATAACGRLIAYF